MLTQDQAVETMTRIRDEYSTTRRYLDSFWTLAMMYAYGRQWGYSVTEYGASIVRGLRNIVDPDREDVRVTMDKIRENITDLVARMSPQRIAAHSAPATTDPTDRTICDTSDRLLERWMESTGALSVVRGKDEPRFVLGTVCIRRTLRRTTGQGAIRPYRLGLALAHPWEFIRDPAILSLDPARDDECIIHEKPRTLAWLETHLGVKLNEQDVDSTLGGLLDYQKQTHAARDVIGANYSYESKQKAVIVYEAYYKSPGGPQEWSQMLLGWCDPQRDAKEVKVISFGPNPMYGLPFHFFHCDRTIESPVARGVPHLLMEKQNITNMAWTWLLRMIQAGSGKIVVEKGTVDDIQDMLSNRVDKPLVWHRPAGTQGQFTKAPSRLEPPQMNPAILHVLERMPRWMGEALNFTDVQRGITSKRGESGEAVQLKLDAASAPLENLRTWDTIEIQNLLLGALTDLTNPDLTTLDDLRQMIGPDVPDESIRALLRKPITESVRAVMLLPSTLRPKTPSEYRDDIKDLALAQIVDAETAKWEMHLNGVPVDSILAGAERKQRAEIAAMQQGQWCAVDMYGDEHQYHKRALRQFMNQPSALDLPPEIRALIERHWYVHDQCEITLAMGQGQMSEPNRQASPPGGAATEAVGSGAGSLNPAISVA